MAYTEKVIDKNEYSELTGFSTIQESVTILECIVGIVKVVYIPRAQKYPVLRYEDPKSRLLFYGKNLISGKEDVFTMNDIHNQIDESTKKVIEKAQHFLTSEGYYKTNKQVFLLLSGTNEN